MEEVKAADEAVIESHSRAVCVFVGGGGVMAVGSNGAVVAVLLF